MYHLYIIIKYIYKNKLNAFFLYNYYIKYVYIMTTPKKPPTFYCETCLYGSNKKSEFDRHLLTMKHATLNTKTATDKMYSCKCGKIYKHSSTWYTHKKKCALLQPVIDEPKLITDATFMQIMQQHIQQNNEFKTLILDIIKNGHGNGCNNTIITNSNNKSFNLQFFLNETCKNAMNITDFIDSVKLQMSDLMDVGKIGYVDGISNIITKKLNALDETIRPVHCTDQKREIFYIKDANVWEKDDPDKKNMQKLIRRISYKNELMLNQYKIDHPGCNFSESPYADQYCKLFLEVMSGDKEKYEKIIRNLRKTTIIKEHK